MGVEIIEGAQEAAATAIKCFEQFGECMIEKFIEGREITVGVVNGRALPVLEIVSKRGFYDYQAKYIDDATEYLFDTIEDEQLVEELQRVSVKCFNLLGCRHLGRVDLMLSDDGVGYVLEVNTLPGFTSHSLLPMAAAKSGVDMSSLCMEIIEGALETAGVKR